MNQDTDTATGNTLHIGAGKAHKKTRTTLALNMNIVSFL